MAKHFYNTLNLSGKALEIANARAAAQEDLVAEIYAANPGVHISPSQIMELVSKKYQRNCPLTSWRRSITNLTKINVLIKTDKKVPGKFGMEEHTWVYNKPKASDQELSDFMHDLTSGKLDEPKLKQPTLF
jgi:hypothetical protein